MTVVLPPRPITYMLTIFFSSPLSNHLFSAFTYLFQILSTVYAEHLQLIDANGKSKS